MIWPSCECPAGFWMAGDACFSLLGLENGDQTKVPALEMLTAWREANIYNTIWEQCNYYYCNNGGVRSREKRADETQRWASGNASQRRVYLIWDKGRERERETDCKSRERKRRKGEKRPDLRFRSEKLFPIKPFLCVKLRERERTRELYQWTYQVPLFWIRRLRLREGRILQHPAQKPILSSISDTSKEL